MQWHLNIISLGAKERGFWSYRAYFWLSAQRLFLLAFKEPYAVLEIGPRSAVYKANTLAPELLTGSPLPPFGSLAPPGSEINFCIFSGCHWTTRCTPHLSSSPPSPQGGVPFLWRPIFCSGEWSGAWTGEWTFQAPWLSCPPSRMLYRNHSPGNPRLGRTAPPSGALPPCRHPLSTVSSLAPPSWAAQWITLLVRL